MKNKFIDIIKFEDSGLHCDNSNCDWENKGIHRKLWDKFLNSSCPKCGENILTKGDLNRAKLFFFIINICNKVGYFFQWLGWKPNPKFVEAYAEMHKEIKIKIK